MSKIEDINRFYTCIDNFKNKLVNILSSFDNNVEKVTELNRHYDKLHMLKKASVRKPIELFHIYVIVKYTDVIASRNDIFFLNEIDTLTEENTIESNDMLFIDQIKQIWSKLDEKIKKTIWDNIQVVSLLAEKILDRNELRSKIGEYRSK